MDCTTNVKGSSTTARNPEEPNVDKKASVDWLKTSVLDLIDIHAKRNPNGIAADFQGATITYGQLRDASIHVAMVLRERGFKQRDRIPLFTSMSLEMLVAVLGILRVGASYCPIDFNVWSMSRIEATMEAINSPLVFSTLKTEIAGYTVVYIPDMLQTTPSDITTAIEETQKIRNDLRPSDLIYIIFTSGTTGKPKGVMVSHSSVVHLAQQDFPGSMQVPPGERALLFFSVAFDGCAGVIFSTLCCGGTLAMAMPSDVLDVAATCNTLIVTPSILANLEPTPQFDAVSGIYMGGEAPTEALVAAWTTSTRKVYNCYGPTECTTAVSTVEMIPGGPIVLGHLVSEVEIVLLDETLEQEREEGEICIRGPCLAVGYLNNEDLTRQKFFMRDGIRHYRTGDLARRSPEGLHFVARVDRLVKNRGFLINLEAEVEPALRSFPAVKQAVAFIHKKQLVGFVSPSQISVTQLREHLAKTYDKFIIPDLLFSIQEFPLTNNGKIDAKALEATVADGPEDTEIATEAIVEQSATISYVINAFAQVFDRQASLIGPATSFGKLGGNSLKAIKIASLLRRAELSIPIASVLLLDSVFMINNAITSLSNQPIRRSSQPTQDDPKTAPLTPHQANLLFQTREEPSSNYIFYSLTRDTGIINVSHKDLRQAWEIIFDRHSIYRTTFDLENGTQTVQYAPKFVWKDFSVATVEEMHRVYRSERQQIWNMIVTPQNPTSIIEPHFWIINLPGEKIQMNWVLHHAYTDAWSFGLLLAELDQILNGFVDQLPLAPSFFNLAHFLSSQNKQEHDKIQKFWADYTLSYWRYLRPIKLPAPSVPSSEPWTVWEMDTAVQKSILDEFSRVNNVSSAIVIFTVWALLLSRYTGSNTVGMNVSVSGRNLDFLDVDGVFGSLNGRCPLLAKLKDDDTIQETMRYVQRNFLGANEYQWTYPELRRLVQTQDSNSTYWLDSQITVLLDMTVDPGPWKIVEFQKPTAPVWLGLVKKGDTINLRLRYDGRRFASLEAEQMGRHFAEALDTFTRSPGSTLVRDVLNTVS